MILCNLKHPIHSIEGQPLDHGTVTHGKATFQLYPSGKYLFSGTGVLDCWHYHGVTLGSITFSSVAVGYWRDPLVGWTIFPKMPSSALASSSKISCGEPNLLHQCNITCWESGRSPYWLLSIPQHLQSTKGLPTSSTYHASNLLPCLPLPRGRVSPLLLPNQMAMEDYMEEAMK